MVNRPTAMITMNSAAIAGMKYKSANDAIGVGAGVGVAGAGSTVRAVCADDR